MATPPAVQRISASELDPLLAELRRQGTTELILLGPGFELPPSAAQWPQELRDKPKIHQLTERVEGLAVRLAALTQLTSLNLEFNVIGDAGAASLAALTQLTSLDLAFNQIGNAGAASLAVLTQLTSLNLGGNQIGDAGAISLAALTQLTSLNLGRNEIGAAGAASLAALSQLTSLNLAINQIEDAGAASLASLTQLTALDLSANPVKETTAFASLNRLTTLNLRAAKVQDLSPLQGLLQGGLVAQWETVDYKFDSGINVFNCPLIHPPPEIVQQGQKAILSYLQETARQALIISTRPRC